MTPTDILRLLPIGGVNVEGMSTSDNITYSGYLELGQLLSAQKPLTFRHDEMLFIVIHHTKELWLKQMLHEIRFAAKLISENRFSQAYKALARVSRIQTIMLLSWDVLSTLTPLDYLAFRDMLGTASGFQSEQFRELEYRLGLKEPRFLRAYAEGSGARAQLEAALAEPSLREEALAALERAGFDLGDRSTEALAEAWRKIYRDSDRWFDFYELAEKLIDVDDALTTWRHKHALTVERIIGSKPGLGGSSGAPYLHSTLSKRVFPELWALRTGL